MVQIKKHLQFSLFQKCGSVVLLWAPQVTLRPPRHSIQHLCKSLFSKDEELDVFFVKLPALWSGAHFSLGTCSWNIHTQEISPLSYMEKGRLPHPAFLLFLIWMNRVKIILKACMWYSSNKTFTYPEIQIPFILECIPDSINTKNIL